MISWLEMDDSFYTNMFDIAYEIYPMDGKQFHDFMMMLICHS